MVYIIKDGNRLKRASQEAKNYEHRIKLIEQKDKDNREKMERKKPRNYQDMSNILDKWKRGEKL